MISLITRSPAARLRDVDVAVVRIAAERMPASLQFPIQIVEQDVRQQRRQRPALRRAFRRGSPPPPPSCPLRGTGGSASAPAHRSTSRATRAISRSWLTRSKNFSRSMSTTQRLPCAHMLAARLAPPDAHCAPAESRSSPPRTSARRSVAALDAAPAGSADPPPSECPASAPRPRLRYVHPAHRLRQITARQQRCLHCSASAPSASL